MLQSLLSAVEDTQLSMTRDAERLDHPPNIEKLCDAVESLCVQEVGNAGMEV